MHEDILVGLFFHEKRFKNTHLLRLQQNLVHYFGHVGHNLRK
jgi:hypothetical protein